MMLGVNMVLEDIIKRMIYVVLVGLIGFSMLVEKANAVRGMDGGFIGIYQGDKKAWTAERWGKELGYLQSVGMNTAVISTAVYNTTAFYSGCSLAGSTTLDDTLTKILDYGDAHGMKFIIGLYAESSSWSQYGQTSSYLANLCKTSKKVCDDVWSQYSSRPSFAGWYIPQEIDNLNWTTEADRNTLVKNYLRPLSDYCRAKDSTKLVSEAPFYNDNLQSAADYGTWWNKTLADCTSLNLLIPQDGIGAAHADYTSIQSYFNAFKTACTTHHRVLWADIEAYESLSNQGPTSIGRLTTQINVVDPYVTGITCWEYYSCLSPLRALSCMTLYNHYDEYVNGVNLAKGKTYSALPAPHASYADDGIKLTDTLYPYTWASQVGWQNPGTNPVVIIDLGAVKTSIGEVRAHCMRSDGSGVYAPQSITVSGSSDGLSYQTWGSALCSSPDNGYINIYDLKWLNADARYVKLEFIPDSRNAFTMVNDILIRQGTGMVPVELSSFEAE